MIGKKISLRTIIQKDHFIKNIFILAGGTAFAQVLAVLISPLLTRLFAPEDFGLLQTYISMLSLIVVIASLRYEMAIPLPKNNKMAINLLLICFLITVMLTIVLGVVLWLLEDALANWLRIESLGEYIWYIVVSFLGVGIYQALNYWSIRERHFKAVAATKVTQSVMQSVTQLGLGLIGWTKTGLIIGDTAGRITGSGRLFTLTLKNEKELFKSLSYKRMRVALKRYKKFPLLSSWSALLNSSGTNLAPLLIIMIYGPAVGGFFALSQRVIGIPMSLIGTAVSQVYFSDASKIRQGALQGSLKSLYMSTAKKLFLLMIGPIVLLAVLAPYIFGLVFGTEWREAGVFVQLLSLMFLAQFIVTPLSQTLMIMEKQDWQLYWDIGRLLCVLIGILLCNHFGATARVFIAVYSLTMFVTYFVHLFLSLQAIRKEEQGSHLGD